MGFFVNLYNTVAELNPGTILIIYCLISGIPMLLTALAGFLSGVGTGIFTVLISIGFWLLNLFCHYLVMYGLIWLSSQFEIYPKDLSAYAILAIILLFRKPSVGSLLGNSKEK